MGLLYGELHEFSFFWDAVARLHRLTTTEFMDRMLSASLSEDNSLLAEEEKMNAREALLNAAVCDHEKLASNITTRVQNIQPERALLKAACEDGAAREKIAPVAASSQEDENAVAAAKHALESLHAATESLLKRKQEADSAKNAVCDKLGEVTDHISALKQAVNSISLIAEEMTGAAGELRAKCVCLRRELDSKERYCFEQDRLLTEAESNYEELKSMVSQLADDESAKTAQLNNAELEHRGICLRIDSAKQKAVAVRAANAKLKELLEVAQSEGKFLTQEVQYLENLVPDKAILERVVHHGAPNPECKHPLPATRGFLDFVQKARVSQRTRLECT
ncbi:hypothetical protein ABL78_8283 [Leptomonas seymouri]|uniref:Uncharacterized protein n=1 Tax=Leptomonas seymouri TaxID=5684 RepID=A0A0N1P9S1_LEPSE|nr:hypothetical protein ABL78_8283 [Leptomonas seymouri]|eukprot:KPI82704.1 hypothetical protein ABL78_8283 [Leptomonas seymouri]